MVQKFKNLKPRLKGPPFWYIQILSYFISSLYWAYAENFKCLASVVERFGFWRPRFAGKNPILVPLLWLNFIFLLYLLISNILCFQLKRFKTLICGRSCLKGLPNFEPHFLLGLVYF